MNETAMSSRPFIQEIHPQAILSYAPDTEPIALRSLNVLIGPNGSGKSNFIELLQLFKGTPTDLEAAVRDAGGMNELVWKGPGQSKTARLALKLDINTSEPIYYELGLRALRDRFRVHNELIARKVPTAKIPSDDFYYRNDGVVAELTSRQGFRMITARSLDDQQSILSQRKDPDLYPEMTALGRAAGRITAYREWAIGPYASIRQPQPADLPNDILLPDARNLGMILNAMSVDHSESWERLNEMLRRFLPRFKAISTYVAAGTVQVFLHEEGLRAPVAASRISDGTIRFIALLAILLRTDYPSVICLEEPELGLHPDALRLVADVLVDASTRTQVVVTTQSDVLISALTEAAESVLVCENIQGGTRMLRLDAEKLQFWLSNYQLGEIWRMGELGGNP
jgi:predicted ATPase